VDSLGTEKAAPGISIAVALAKHGGDRRSAAVKAEGKNDQGSDRTLKRGENREYLTARLDRDRPDIAAQVCGKSCGKAKEQVRMNPYEPAQDPDRDHKAEHARSTVGRMNPCEPASELSLPTGGR